MAGCQGTGNDRGVSSSRWRKTQTRRQADNSRTMDLAWAKGWEHRRTANRESKEKKRAIDIDRANVNYDNPTSKLENVQCLDSSPIAGTTWKR